MTETERAWLAGFMDGEGCLSANISGNLPYARIQISQKDRAVLERIREKLGYGTISRCSSGTHLLRIASRENVRDFIRLVYPYAVVKKDALRLSFMLTNLQSRPWQDDPIGHARRAARRHELASQLRVRSVA